MYDRAKIESLICKKIRSIRLRRKERAKIYDPGKKPGLWTYEYVSKMTGISTSSLENMEKGIRKTELSYMDLIALIDLFGKELEDFVDEVVKANKM